MPFFYKIFLMGLAGHVFVFAHALCVFGRGKWFVFAVPWLACMSLTLLLHPWQGYNTPQQGVLAWVENTWLPSGLSLLLLLMLIDAFCLFHWRFNATWCAAGRSPISLVYTVCGVLVVGVALAAYGAHEARTIRAEHLTLTTDKPLGGRQKLRIVFASDVHLNSWIGPEDLKKVTDCIQAQNPDMILLGGDTVDADMKGRDAELALLRDLKAPDGKFAVLGNHDVAHGIAQAVDFTQRAGFTVLRQQAVKAGGIFLAGVDDPRAAAVERTHKDDPMPLLHSLSAEDQRSFVLLLKHRPQVETQSSGLFDLQLSGHSHGGQIWPARYVAEYFFDAPSGLRTYDSPAGESTVFVTVGTGFSRMPIRFLTPPEIVVIDLVSTAPLAPQNESAQGAAP